MRKKYNDMSMVPVLRRLRQEDIQEFNASEDKGHDSEQGQENLTKEKN